MLPNLEFPELLPDGGGVDAGRVLADDIVLDVAERPDGVLLVVRVLVGDPERLLELAAALRGLHADVLLQGVQLLQLGAQVLHCHTTGKLR